MTYANDIDKWYSEYAKDQLGGAQNMMATGAVPSPIMEALQSTVNQGLKKSMGSSLNDLASRGVLNSSVTNKGMSDMSNAAGDALNRGYLDAFNSALAGYQGNAGTAATAGSQLVDSTLKVNNNALGLGESLAKTGSMQTSDILNVLASNRADRDQLLGAVPQYYQNVSAPLAQGYDYLQTMLQDHWNSDKKDTIVKQGK
jgi:hypothetical protein